MVWHEAREGVRVLMGPRQVREPEPCLGPGPSADLKPEVPGGSSLGSPEGGRCPLPTSLESSPAGAAWTGAWVGQRGPPRGARGRPRAPCSSRWEAGLSGAGRAQDGPAPMPAGRTPSPLPACSLPGSWLVSGMLLSSSWKARQTPRVAASSHPSVSPEHEPLPSFFMGLQPAENKVGDGAFTGLS